MNDLTEHVATVRRLDELKRRLELEDAWAAGAHAMVPYVAILGGFVVAVYLHSWWVGILVAIAALVALSYVVQRKAYQLQDEYDKATATNLYAGEKQSPAAREHLFGSEAGADQNETGP